MSVWQNYKNADMKKKIVYILILLLLLLVIIFAGVSVFMFSGKKEVTEVSQNQALDTLEIEPVQPGEIRNDFSEVDDRALQEQRQEQQREMPVRLIAEPFVERFGSYNNQGSFNNFKDLEFFMTNSLSNWVFTTYVSQLSSDLPDIDNYYAINTKVISSSVENLDDQSGQATILVKTQRQEVGAGGEEKNVFFQDARVELKKIDGQWKVDGIFWL